MKPLHLFLTILFTLPTLAFAQTVVSGQQLEIGPSGSDQVYGTTSSSYGGAIGRYNQASTSGLAVGESNIASGYSLAVGTGNTSGISGASIGAENINHGDYCILLGASNIADTSSEEGSAAVSVAVGAVNVLSNDVSYSLIAGYNNFAYTATASITLGRGLINHWSNSTVVGQYNDSAITEPLLFAVGNGADSTNRSNAFEVHASGTILMPRQGDILMGEFGE